jgi:hypothetical protein
VCHVNSSACRVYVTYTTSISFYKSFYTFCVFIYFLQLHFRGHFRVHYPRLHSSVDAQRRFYSTPTLICGCTAVSTVLQLHFRGHFRVHFRTSTPTFICGRTATSVSYTYTHLLYILHIVASSTSMPVCVASIYTSAAHHLPCFQGGKECMATLHSSDRDFTFPYILHLRLFIRANGRSYI